MVWSTKYTLITKSEWISISEHGALLMSIAAGNEARYEDLWQRVGNAVKRDIERIVPMMCKTEPDIDTLCRVHLPMDSIVPGLHVFCAFKVVPQWRQIGVEYRIMTALEAELLKQDNPVKHHVELPNENHSGYPATLPAQGYLH